MTLTCQATWLMLTYRRAAPCTYRALLSFSTLIFFFELQSQPFWTSIDGTGTIVLPFKLYSRLWTWLWYEYLFQHILWFSRHEDVSIASSIHGVFGYLQPESLLNPCIVGWVPPSRLAASGCSAAHVLPCFIPISLIDTATPQNEIWLGWLGCLLSVRSYLFEHQQNMRSLKQGLDAAGHCTIACWKCLLAPERLSVSCHWLHHINLPMLWQENWCFVHGQCQKWFPLWKNWWLSWHVLAYRAKQLAQQDTTKDVDMEDTQQHHREETNESSPHSSKKHHWVYSGKDNKQEDGSNTRRPVAAWAEVVSWHCVFPVDETCVSVNLSCVQVIEKLLISPLVAWWPVGSLRCSRQESGIHGNLCLLWQFSSDRRSYMYYHAKRCLQLGQTQKVGNITSMVFLPLDSTGTLGAWLCRVFDSWMKAHWRDFSFSLQAFNHANILVFKYQYMLNPKVAKMVSKELEAKSIIVFDEAHNIDSVCINALSININERGLEQATRSLGWLLSEVTRIKASNSQQLQTDYQNLVNGLVDQGLLDQPANDIGLSSVRA